jgi:hypothetical protein
MNPLEVLWSVGTLKRHFHAQDRVVWRKDRRNRPSLFCWARWQETNKRNNKKGKKLTETLYVDPLWAGPLWSADDDLWPVRSSFERIITWVEFIIDWSKGFGCVRGQFWRTAIVRPTRPYNIACTTVQHLSPTLSKLLRVLTTDFELGSFLSLIIQWMCDHTVWSS